MKLNLKNILIRLQLPIMSCLVIFGRAAWAQNQGSLPVWLLSSVSNSVTGCFAFTNGWDKYIVMTNIFIGPNYSLTQFPTGAILNTNHYTNLSLSTCNSSNGSNLVTELVVINNFHPTDGETKCGTNLPGCTFNTNASAFDFKMTNTSDACYRVSVIYKSSTTNGLTNIMINWAYTNN